MAGERDGGNRESGDGGSLVGGPLNHLHVRFRRLNVIAHAGLFLERGGGAFDDFLYLRGHDRVWVLAAEDIEECRSQNVVAVGGDEVDFQVLQSTVNLVCAFRHLLVRHGRVHTAEYHLRFLVGQIDDFLFHSALLLQETVQAVVEQTPHYPLLRVADRDGNVPVLDDNRHETLVVHVDLAHDGGVHHTHETELSMNDLAGIDVLHDGFAGRGFQIQHPAVQGGDRGIPGDVVLLGAREHARQASEQEEDADRCCLAPLYDVTVFVVKGLQSVLLGIYVANI